MDPAIRKRVRPSSMRVPRSAWAVAAVSVAVFSGLTACTSSGDHGPPAAESIAPTGSGSHVAETPAVSSTMVTIPWRVRGVSPHARTMDITFRGSMCTPQHVSVRHTRRPETTQASWVTTISVRQITTDPQCIGGRAPSVTKTIHAKHAMLGCASELVDGSTGEPPKFKQSLHLVWNCPEEAAP